jgi:hypothetical protein
MSDLLSNRLNKEEIVRQLHEMIDHHLFGSAGWPADKASRDRLWHFAEQHGLRTRVPGTDNTIRYTALGVECGLPLATYLIGAHDPLEIPEQLHDLGLISLEDMEAAWSLPIEGQDYLQCVEKLVREAYTRSFGLVGRG